MCQCQCQCQCVIYYWSIIQWLCVWYEEIKCYSSNNKEEEEEENVV